MSKLLRADLYRLLRGGLAKTLLIVNGLFTAALAVILRTEAYFDSWLHGTDVADFHNAVLLMLLLNALLFCPLFVRSCVSGGGTARRLAAGYSARKIALSAALTAFIFVAALYALECAVCYPCALSPWCGYGAAGTVSAHAQRILGGFALALAYCSCFVFLSFCFRHGATALIACALALLFAWGWYDWFGRALAYFTGNGIGVPATVLVTIAVQGLSPHAILMTAFGGYGGWALYIACGVVFAALCHCLCTVVLRRKSF